MSPENTNGNFECSCNTLVWGRGVCSYHLNIISASVSLQVRSDRGDVSLLSDQLSPGILPLYIRKYEYSKMHPCLSFQHLRGGDRRTQKCQASLGYIRTSVKKTEEKNKKKHRCQDFCNPRVSRCTAEASSWLSVPGAGLGPHWSLVFLSVK